MPWMAVPNEAGDQIHAVPYCITGHIVKPHVLNYDCKCKPELQEVGQGLLVIHNSMIGDADGSIN